MTTKQSPRFDLEGFSTLQVRYDGADDIAVIHLDGPRAAVSWEVDDSWYLRVADDEIVGMELHALRRRFLSTRPYADLFREALAELMARAEVSDLDAGIEVSASVDELPKTTHLVIFLVGRATEKVDAALRERYADAGQALIEETASA